MNVTFFHRLVILLLVILLFNVIVDINNIGVLAYLTQFINPRSFPSLSFRRICSTCARSSLPPQGTSCTFFPLLPSNTRSLCPRSHICISPSFFFLSRSLSPGTPEYPLFTHLSYSLLYLYSLILSLLSYLSVSLSLSLSSAHIHLPSALTLSTSSMAYPFLLQYFSLSFSSAFFFFSL
jgi:hypothetical protein